MKKLFLFFAVFMSSVFASAQDTIRFVNGRVEAGKVTEVGMGKVKYKKVNNPDGPLFLLDETEVESIKFANGEVETFNQPIVQEEPSYSPVRQKRVVVQAGPIVVDRTSTVNPATYPLRYQKESPSNIAFDGDYLSEQDAFGLLGHNYDEFTYNVRRYRSGRAMWIAGAACGFVSINLAFISIWECSPYIGQAATATAVSSLVLIPVGVVRFASGKVRMKRVLKDYNLDYNSKSHDSAELKLGVTGNGVGMNLSF